MTANRKQRRKWDQYVQEANANTAEVEIGGTVLEVRPPTVDGLNQLAAAERAGDIAAALVAVFGEENAAVITDAAKDAPVTALQGLMKDVMTDLGLGGNLPE